MNGEHFKIRVHKQTTMFCDTYEVLSVAIRWNSSKLARTILKKPTVTLIKSENWTDYILLIKALQRGCKKIVKLFLRNDFRVNRDSKTNFFHTPLYYAVRLGDIKIVSLLLDKGALINGKDHSKETALCLAMKQNRFDIVQVMLSKYFFQMTELNYVNILEHYTAYYIAFLTSDETAMNTFVRLGIYVSELQANLSWCKSKFILHYAVAKELIELIDLLLMIGVNITTKNSEGLTPLHIAFRNLIDYSFNKDLNKSIVERILLAHDKTTENAIDSNGLSHFHIACSTNNTNIVKNFLECGVNINSEVSILSRILPGYTPLHVAVYFKCTAIVSLLLQYNADINLIDRDGCTALHIAANAYRKSDSLSNQSKKIMDLILLAHSERSHNSVNFSGLSHFHIACSRDYPYIVEHFLTHGVDVNSAISFQSNIFPGYTPLHCAVEFQNVLTILVLLQYKPDICAVNAKGLTALHMAFVNRGDCIERDMSDEIVDIILSAYGKRIENPVDCNGLSHFHIACTRNSPSIVENFLKSGVNVNSSVSLESKVLSGYTPIQCAVNYYRTDIVRQLLKYNADLETDDVGLKLLQDSLLLFGQYIKIKNWMRNRNDQYEIIKLILNYKNYTNYKDSLGIPFLFNSYSSFFKFNHISEEILPQKRIYVLREFLIRRQEIIKIFLNYNFDINLSDNNGNTLLHILAKDSFNDNGVMNTAELLLKKGADVNAKTCTGKTPLHIAVENGELHSDLVELFLKYSADVNCIDSEWHSTPLHLVMENYHKNLQKYDKIMGVFLNEGADVNARNINGMTPLHAACKVQNVWVLSELFKYGADINIEDKNGATVLNYLTNTHMCTSRNPIQFYKHYDKFRKHVNRLKAIKYFVSENINIFCSALDPLCNESTNKYYVEIETMKNVKINSYSSLYDMIFKDANKIVTYMTNDSFRNIMNSDRFDTEFPNYGYLLKMQLRKGLKRKPLLQPAKDAVSSIIKIELPDVCLENILVYFNNQELKHLLKVY